MLALEAGLGEDAGGGDGAVQRIRHPARRPPARPRRSARCRTCGFDQEAGAALADGDAALLPAALRGQARVRSGFSVMGPA